MKFNRSAIQKGTRKKLNRSKFGNGLSIFILLFLGAFMLLPLIYTIACSIKPVEEFFVFPPRFYAINPTINNFLDLFDITANLQVPLIRYVFNTVFVTFLGTSVSLFFGTMGAYVLAKHNFVGQRILNKLLLISLLYSGNILFVPRYLIIAKIGWLDTPLAILAPVFASTMTVFLMKQFMYTIPDTILEAAKIDGANEFRVCFQIVMPSIKPAWVTMLIFTFQGLWNNDGGSLIFTETNKLLPSVLKQIASSGIARAGVGAAITLLMIIPPIMVFVIFQKQIIETMASSGVKE